MLFLSDIFPTGYMAAENCQIKPGDTVAVWGCGPVGQFAIQSAYLLGAERVIAIDRFPERLALAASQGKADAAQLHRSRRARQRSAIDGRPRSGRVHRRGRARGARHARSMRGTTGRRPHCIWRPIGRTPCGRRLRPAAKAASVSIPGVYGGWLDKFPLGAAFAKGLTLKMGQTHMHKYMPILLDRIQRGEIDPSFIITHRIALDDAPAMYRTFRDKEDHCIKVVIKPGADTQVRH